MNGQCKADEARRLLESSEEEMSDQTEAEFTFSRKSGRQPLQGSHSGQGDTSGRGSERAIVGRREF